MVKNVYWLYDCAANFFEDLPERVEIEQVDRDYHRVVTTGGQYCGFCYGTYHTEDTKLERHNMETSIRPELAHQRLWKWLPVLTAAIPKHPILPPKRLWQITMA